MKYEEYKAAIYNAKSIDESRRALSDALFDDEVSADEIAALTVFQEECNMDS